MVGPGTGVFSTTDGNGAVVRRGSGGTFVNGIIARWPGVGVSVRDAESKALMDADSLYFRNLILTGNGSNFESPAKNYGYVLSDSAAAWNIMTPDIAAVFSGSLPTSSTSVTADNLGIVPASGSPAVDGGLADFSGTPIAGRVSNYFGGAMPATSFVGAVDPSAGSPWYQGWTQFVRN